ncbi:hypothetical protein GCM10023168_00890 [Fodinibacter luteus]|uniref:Fluoroacetyl-CoA-specific thioesterase-like domain-containing protein n=1 Tax=Fodinibacter luteus TaxID=552064 RepID=A0ABP8JWG4_9MICO
MDGASQILPGTHAAVTRVVGGADTASALGSGSLAVLGTPRLLAWCEEATCLALTGLLPAGATSVGTSVRLDHLAASSVGHRVTVRAEVTATDGQRLTFRVEATDAVGRVLGRGTVERVVVDTERFLGRLGADHRPRT